MKMKEASSILWKVVALVFLISSQSFSLHWVCVDPGHGRIHSGTVGRVYGLLEKDVNFGVGHRASTCLGLANYNVVMTRDEDTTPIGRVFGHFANAHAPRVYIDSLEGWAVRLQ